MKAGWLGTLLVIRDLAETIRIAKEKQFRYQILLIGFSQKVISMYDVVFCIKR